MASLLSELRDFVIHRKPSRKSGLQDPDTQPTALTELNKGLRDMGVLLREIAIKLEEIERQHRAIRTHSSNAWGEREVLLEDYYSVLRGVLSVLDNCENTLSSSSQMLVIFERLKRILEERRIEPIRVKEGDLFDAQLHECEETVETNQYAPGVVVQVIEKGYMHERRDGSGVVIRPVKVRVSKRIADTGG